MAPKDMPNRIQEYCRETNQPVPENEGQIVRCIVESLALRYRLVVDDLERQLGKDLKTIHMIGGGINNKLLCKYTANATGRKVVAGPVEATAMGNLLMQGYALGEIKNLSELRKIVRASTPVEVYVPENRDAWELAYERFLKVTNCK